ncbi:MAG: dicarboxylate/amino acid:cation symporter [Clostridiales Family XIII bacterium]|jgi:Na+/H+-dicarboxylate symporter|nr:dicarboxylate/amino acid:cation symporter [Clostridiales Family XIII bacterium]
MDEGKRVKLGLVPKLVIAIALGILLGAFAPEPVNRLIITFSEIFGSLLRFIIPLMILAFVTMGIADLTCGAGKLLGITAGIAYASTLLTGVVAYVIAVNLFPGFIGAETAANIGDPEAGMLAPLFEFPIAPLMEVPSAITLAFILGLCISMMKGKGRGLALHGLMGEFAAIVNKVLLGVVIPLLPLFICGTFIEMTVSGETFAILGVLWKVFLTVIGLHLTYLLTAFCVSGALTGKNPFKMMRRQIPGYISAIGTQSSAATIPVNLQCAEAMGVSAEIRNFVIPLCANIHMPGSMTTIICCVTSVLLMYNMPVGPDLIIPFIVTLGIAMMAAPGAPGGAIMSALPFLPLVGIASHGSIASILIALYITQDSFGTACNVSGDNAISNVMEMISRRLAGR